MYYPYNNIRFEKQSNMVCIELLISNCYMIWVNIGQFLYRKTSFYVCELSRHVWACGSFIHERN